MPSAAATIKQKKKETITNKTTVVAAVSWLCGTRGGVLSRVDQCGKLDIVVMRQPGCEAQRGYANHYSAHTALLMIMSSLSE